MGDLQDSQARGVRGKASSVHGNAANQKTAETHLEREGEGVCSSSGTFQPKNLKSSCIADTGRDTFISSHPISCMPT